MVIRRLLFNLLNNPQVIEKLSESRAIRRAAQLTAFAVLKAELSGKDAAQKFLRSDTAQQIQQGASRVLPEVGRRAQRVSNSFIQGVRSGMEDAKRQMKKRGSK
ncbi:protein NCBP2AS2 [Pelodytes ibericus]